VISLERKGERRRTEEVGPLILTEVSYPPNLRLASHSHALPAIALTLEGSSVETFVGSKIQRPKETVLFRPGGEMHSDFIGNYGAKCFLIEFDDRRTLGLGKGLLDAVGPFGRRGEKISELAARAYREWIYGDNASRFAIEGLFFEMLAHLLRLDCADKVCDAPPVWLGRVRGVLNDCYRDKLSLDRLSRVGGVHPMHVARSFRRYFGMSVGNYLRQRRVDVAKELLLSTGKPLVDIALECGFSSHAHLCGIFKRFTGLTPTQFRRLRRC
jgi:AraC family transcriptional regulator